MNQGSYYKKQSESELWIWFLAIGNGVYLERGACFYYMRGRKSGGSATVQRVVLHIPIVWFHRE